MVAEVKKDTIRVLYIDDLSSDRALVRRVLTKSDVSVDLTEVSNWQEMKSALAHGRFDLVLTDFDLQTFSGLDVLHELREKDSSLPIIVVTGSGSEEIAVASLKSGAADYILKSNLKRLPGAIQKVYQDSLQQTRLREIEIQKNKLLTALKFSYNGIVITDVEGKIEYTNPSYQRITGYNSKEVLGEDFLLLSHSEQTIPVIDASLKDGSVWKGEIVNKRKNGEEYHEQITISPIPDSDGTLLGYMEVKRDITTEVELKRRELHSQKLESIGLLAGGIAHDFNNSLSRILGYANFVQDALTADMSQAREDLREVIAGANHARNLVKQLLSFSRTSSTSLGSVSLHVLIKETVQMLRPLIPSNVDIQLELCDEAEKIQADKTKIQQLLMNLANNSIHAINGENGLLKFELVQVLFANLDCSLDLSPEYDRYYKLIVSDTGHGMGEETKNKLFEPFYSTKPMGEGTGMGLAVVHGIVSELGGAIEVASFLGKGSTFTVYFPIAVGDKKEIAEEERVVSKTGSGRILVVDDDEKILKYMERSLSGLGYTVVAKLGGPAARNVFLESPTEFDLVISDQSMPEITGFELAKEIMAINPSIPVILCTGYSAYLTETDALAAGIKKIFMKPVSLDELRTYIQNLLL